LRSAVFLPFRTKSIVSDGWNGRLIPGYCFDMPTSTEGGATGA
jgi:hypothetical protein